MVTYDCPIRAELHVHLENGESWRATADDLDRFGLTSRLDAYMRFDEALTKILRSAGLINKDITSAQLNAVRHLVEIAISSPHLLDHPDHNEWAKVAAIERALQQRTADDTDSTTDAESNQDLTDHDRPDKQR